MKTAQIATTGNLVSDHDDPLWFGGMPKYGQYLTGAMDDIRYYNIALTEDDIAALLPEPPIIIVQQPMPVTVRATNGTVTLTVVAQVFRDKLPASGLQYQWYADGAEIPGATSASYTTPLLNTPYTSVRYQVVVSHPQLTKTVSSVEVPVTVLDNVTPPLIGYWNFDEGSGTTALDSAGSHNGIIHGATYIPGRIGAGALQFNGQGNYVEIENATLSELELVDVPYTIAWWQRAKGPNGQFQRIINMDNGNDFNGGYSVDLTAGGNYFSTHNSGPLTNNWDTGIRAATNWEHVAVVWDRFNRTLYVNGVARASQPTGWDLLSRMTDVLWFGAIPVYGQYYAGALDEVRIYSDALSSDEIRALVPALPVINITQQPASLRVRSGSAATFTAAASIVGAETNVVAYQWQRNGTDIAGATGPSYTISATTAADAGSFRVVVTDSETGAKEISAEAVLSVVSNIADALLGHWTFDEGSGTTATDSAGTHDGTINEAAYIPGKIGSGALLLNGTNSYVEVNGATGSDLELTGTRYTVAWWQRWNGPNGKTQRMINMDNGNDFGGGYAFGMFANNSFFATHNNGIDQNWQPGFTPSTNWQHIAVVWDGTNRTMYVDGIVFGTKPTINNIASRGNDVLWFGGIPNYGQNYFGALDDIRIYGVNLTQDEIVGLLPEPPIVISRQPAGVTVRQNQAGGVVLSVEANVYNDLLPASGLRYQWQKDGTDIPGATSATYSPSIAEMGSAHYRVLLTHTQLTQTKTSADAIVTVLASKVPTLAGHWTFDEGSGITATDSAGTHNGTIHDATYVAGKVGSGALLLNGTNSYVEINGATGSALELAGTPYTVAWWQKWNGANGVTQRIINMDNGESFSGGYAFALTGGGTFVLTHNNGSNQNWNPSFMASTNWQHIAVVWDGFNRTLYVNGALIASKATTGDITSRGDDVLWFGAIPKYGQFYGGALDDVRIYSDALSSSEIAALSGPVNGEIVLSISQTQPGMIEIAWLHQAGLQLEAADSLANPAWAPVDQVPQTSGGYDTVTVNAGSGAKFYRVRKP
ncbi:MAG: LamG domain-containing protein [Candidatus Omnitrophica bacterium]|nr:LamG domain-containing protein [Candidatus Omnitrophota bacterium]